MASTSSARTRWLPHPRASFFQGLEAIGRLLGESPAKAGSQRALSSEWKAPQPTSQCFRGPHCARPAPRRRHSCGADPLALPTLLGSIPVPHAARERLFRRLTWVRLWAPLHGLPLTTMSLHTMSVIFSDCSNGHRVVVGSQIWVAIARLRSRYHFRNSREAMIECRELAGKVVRRCQIDKDGKDGPEIHIVFTDETVFFRMSQDGCLHRNQACV
jgi:hypothetical protein